MSVFGEREYNNYKSENKQFPWDVKHFDTQLTIGDRITHEQKLGHDYPYDFNENPQLNLARQSFKTNQKFGISKQNLKPFDTNEEVFKKFDFAMLNNNSGISGIYEFITTGDPNMPQQYASFTFRNFLNNHGYSQINTGAKHNNNRSPVAIFYAIQFYNNVIGAPDYGELVLTVFSKPFDVSMYKFSRQNITFFLPIVLALFFNINPNQISVCFIHNDDIHKGYYIISQYNHEYGEKYPTHQEIVPTIVDDTIIESQVSEFGNVTLNNGQTISTEIIFSYFFEYLLNVFGLKNIVRKQKTIPEQKLSKIPIEFYNNFWANLIEYATSLQTPGGGKKYRKISKTKRKIQRSKRRKHRSQKKH